MNVEIINVGTELLLGEIVNTNATYLQKMCKELGFNVFFQTVVGDNSQRFLDCLDIAFNRGCDCVITTGELGPTEDDLTKELSAKYLGLEMIFDEDEAKKVNDKCCFVTQLDKVSDNNFKQAYFPKNCYVLDNPIGTANGCVMSKDKKMIVNLPGPPKEMTYVVDHQLKPYLEKYRQAKIYTYDLVTQGIGESAAATLIDDIVQSQKDISIALYASEEYVRVRLGVKAKHQSEADEFVKQTKKMIEEKLKDYLVENPNLFEEVMKKVNGFTILNECDFLLSDYFVNNGGPVFIHLTLKEHPLGEIVHVLLKYKEKEIFKLYKAINEDSSYVGALDLKPKGNLGNYLDDLREHVVPYKNISLAFALGVSSSIVAKLNMHYKDINTLLVHLFAESTKGKSTAAMLAISVWGNPNLSGGGLYNTWNSTENALSTSLAGNYGIAYALDELSMSKIEDTTSLIYNLVGGKDKARLTKDIELRAAATWTTSIISTGEVSLLSKAKNNTGLDIRVLELGGIVWTEDANHSDQVKALVNRNYGVFGADFVKRLIEFPADRLKEIFEEEREIFIQKVKEKNIQDDMLSRTSCKYAIVTLTIRLINSRYKDRGIILDIEGIRELLVDTEINSINRRGIKRKAEDWLIQYIESNASKFKSGKETNTNVDYWGTRKELPNGELEVAILTNKFEEIMRKGKFEDTKVVLEQLKKEGKLEYEAGRLTRKRKVNAIQTPVYVIRLSQ